MAQDLEVPPTTEVIVERRRFRFDLLQRPLGPTADVILALGRLFERGTNGLSRFLELSQSLRGSGGYQRVGVLQSFDQSGHSKRRLCPHLSQQLSRPVSDLAVGAP